MSEIDSEHWYQVDLHIHTPALTGENGLLLGLLHRAESLSLDIMGLVDHNSVCGYEQLRLETGRLLALGEAGRLSDEQEQILSAYQRLQERLLLLPGFELATQEGHTLLCLFAPDTSAERLYALLLNLGIPMERLRTASADVRAQADLSTACALVSQAGGIVIAGWPAAGAELPEAAALPPGLLAREAAGLSMTLLPGALPTTWFSAAGCLYGRPAEKASRKIGARCTEMRLVERSFDGLRAALSQADCLRLPEKERRRAYLEQLRQQGGERMLLRGADADPQLLYRDVAALANSGGGILVIGLAEDGAAGVESPEVWSTALARATREQIDPAPRLNLELVPYEDKELVRAEIQSSAAPPYLTPEGVVYLCDGGNVRPAGRRDLLEMVSLATPSEAAPSGSVDLPQAGVEIVGAYLRDGTWFYDVRDLRVTSGVTQQRAKGLWAYAIERQEMLRQGQVNLAAILWKGAWGIWRAYRSGERRVFDLVHRDANGRIDHIFYGVSEWGLTPRWREVVESLRPPLAEDEAETAMGTKPPVGEPAADAAPAAPSSRRAERADGPREWTAAQARRETTVVATEPAAAVQSPVVETSPAAPPAAEESPGPVPGERGGRLPRWRGQAAVERVYWEGNNLYFDLVMRQADEQLRYFRHVPRHHLTSSEGWADLVRVPLPATGIEVVRSTSSGDEILYQFRDMQTGRVDPRVRREADFAPDSPYRYAIQNYHRDCPLDESRVRWWGNIGYLRIDDRRVDLLYRDEEGRDHIYYAAERDQLDGEWKELLDNRHKE